MSFLKNIKTPEQLATEKSIAEKKQRVRELQLHLDNTDHKTFSDYEPKEGESLEAIIANRSAWRSEIRQLQSEIPDELVIEE